MQRQHKYQYWYGRKMLEVGQIEFFTDGSYRVNDELVGGVLREWTGLHDKNGKEIFEGDVMANSQYKPGDAVEIIKFKNGGFYGESGASANLYMNVGYFTKEAQVIGNIYENPELLK